MRFLQWKLDRLERKRAKMERAETASRKARTKLGIKWAILSAELKIKTAEAENK